MASTLAFETKRRKLQREKEHLGAEGESFIESQDRKQEDYSPEGRKKARRMAIKPSMMRISRMGTLNAKV